MVIAIAVIAINPFTGNAVSSGSDEKVTTVRLFDTKPTEELTEDTLPVISRGGKLYIVVESGSKGCRKTADIMQESATGRTDSKVSDVNLCGGDANCPRNRVLSAGYRTSTSWEPGTYYVRVKDNLLTAQNEEGQEVFVTARFRVK